MKDQNILQDIMAGYYRQYRKRIFRYAYSMLQNRADAEDIVQNTFYQAWKNFGKLRDHSSVRQWLYRIAYNKILYLCARDPPTKVSRHSFPIYSSVDEFYLSYGVAEIPDERPLPDEVAAAKETEKRIMEELKGMKEPDRTALLCALDEEPYEQIASRLDTTIVAVKSRLFHTRHKLRKKVAPYVPRKKWSRKKTPYPYQTGTVSSASSVSANS